MKVIYVDKMRYIQRGGHYTGSVYTESVDRGGVYLQTGIIKLD